LLSPAAPAWPTRPSSWRCRWLHGPAPPIEIAAGAEDDRLGTDAVRVAEAIVAADDGAGVVVIMDLGSAVLSAELAVDLVPDQGIKIRLVSAAFVEGIFTAVVAAAGGAALDVVARDAEEAVYAKSTQLRQRQTSTADAVPDLSAGGIVATATIINPDGIHARPAALIVGATCLTRCAGHDRHRDFAASLSPQSYRVDVAGCSGRRHDQDRGRWLGRDHRG